MREEHTTLTASHVYIKHTHTRIVLTSPSICRDMRCNKTYPNVKYYQPTVKRHLARTRRRQRLSVAALGATRPRRFARAKLRMSRCVA